MLSVYGIIKQVRPSSRTDVYPHMPILRPHAARFHERRICSVTLTFIHLYSNVYMRVGVARVLANSSDLGFWGSKVHKNGRLHALDADKYRHAKFDTASFIIGREIRNHTNKYTSSNRYVKTLPIGMCE